MALVIGYGNLMRGDDAVGPLVAGRFGGIAAHQLLPEMAERISREDFVVFVDARAGVEPGSVTAVEIEGRELSTHSCSPGGLLTLSLLVYGRAPKAILIGIGAESFEPGAPLSAPAREGVEAASRRIRTLLQSVCI